MHLDPTHRPKWQRYLIALVAVAVAAGVRLYFLDFLGPRLPLVTFLPAVLLVFLFAGASAGLLALLFSALFAFRVSAPIEQTFLVRDAADRTVVVAALLVSLTIYLVARALGSARRRAAAAEAALELAEQRRADQLKLLESEAQLKQAQEIAKLGSWSFDASGCCWSEESYAIFGVSPQGFDPNADSVLELVREEDRPALQQWLAACQGGEEPGALEFGVLRPDGTLRQVSARGRVLASARDGAPVISGTFQDVTDARQAADDKARLESQLQQAQKMESVGRLAGGVAHDFNNMLCVIIGHANLALMELEPVHPLHLHLAEIQKAAERSAELTRQLLAFARKQTVAPRQLDLNDKVAGMLKMLHRIIGEEIELAWQPEPQLWPVRIDPSQVDQMLANLCVNARDAIAGQGRITLATANRVVDPAQSSRDASLLPGEHVQLSVTDDGCGMDRQTLALIFEPFFTTKGVGAGTGLGLAMVYGVIKQNHGFIEVVSAPGAGTTFHICLPRYLPDGVPSSCQERPLPAPGGRETVLLVEDEPSLLKTAELALARQGYRVLAAQSPVEALELAGRQAGEIALLLTDVIMPAMNGRELARELLSRHPELKCLFMSGYTSEIIAVHGVLDEEVNFIQKPFTTAELAAKVRAVLDLPHPRPKTLHP